jgi:hypothetical protein
LVPDGAARAARRNFRITMKATTAGVHILEK